MRIAYESAIEDLLRALAQVGDPSSSPDERAEAHRKAVAAALVARQASLAMNYDWPSLENGDEAAAPEVERDLWVPPHLQPRNPNRRFDGSEKIEDRSKSFPFRDAETRA